MSTVPQFHPPLWPKFVLLGSLLFALNTIAAPPHPSLNSLALFPRDSLIVYLDQRPLGWLSSGITYDSTAAQYRFSTTISVANWMGPAANEDSITIAEHRHFDHNYLLVSASQSIASSSGQNLWQLQRAGEGWELVVTVGGQRTVQSVNPPPDNCRTTLQLYHAIAQRSLAVGQTWVDSAFDMTAAQVLTSTTVCMALPSADNGSCYVFMRTDHASQQQEEWFVDTLGRTIRQQLQPLFVALAPGLQPGRPVVGMSDVAELLTVKTAKKPTATTTLRLRSTVDNFPDSSVAHLYTIERQGGVLKRLPTACSSMPGSSAERGALEKFCEPTIIMQSTHPAIVHLADSLVGGVGDGCQRMSVLTEYVYRTIRKRNTATFSSALETLTAGYGDCGEHAVLLGALARAAGIPARIVLGLVYVPSAGGFQYHAWVALWEGEWFFADAAFGVFPAHCGLLPLVIDDSGQQGAVVARMMGRFSIEVIPFKQRGAKR